MPSLTLSSLLALAATTPAMDPSALARLEALQQSSAVAGELIYRGSVSDPKASSAAPVFHYERRVGPRSASHITRSMDGEVLIAEEASFAAGYALQRFDAVNKQQGYSGWARISDDGRRIDYHLVQRGKLSTASEAVADPVVSGPSLHGFILQHWESLAVGARIPARMIVLAEKTSYGFEIRLAESANGQTSFAITPSSWLVRLAVAPLRVSFETDTRNVLRYEGRVPPMREAGGKLEAFDARVDYTMAVARYR